MIEVTLVTFLKTLDTVTAIVGVGDAARIRPERLEESDGRPAIAIEIEDEEPQNCIIGVGGLVFADVSIYSTARTMQATRALVEAIRINGTDPGTGLAGHHGTTGGVMFDAVLISREPDFVPATDASQNGSFIINSLYTVSYHETT